MITSVNLALFPSNELLTFGQGTISLVESKKTQLPAIYPFLDNVILKCNNYEGSLERELKNPMVKLQSARDHVRSDDFTAYRDYCQSAETRRKPGWSEAAGRLLAVIRRHGWSAQFMGYKAKTAAINKIITETRTKYQGDVIMINADEWLRDLEMSETEFLDTAKQVVEVASANHEPLLADTRPELIAALKALFQTVSLQQIAAPSAELDALTTQLNEFIVTSLASVKAAGTRAENLKNAAETKPAAN
jgi:hypothetical protein